MNILKKIFTAFRGGVHQASKGGTEANAIRIFEQELRDAKDALQQAKKSLTEVMAKEMQYNRAIRTIDFEITKHEKYALNALSQDNESLALEIAEKIADLEQEKNLQVDIVQGFKNQILTLKQHIKNNQRTILEQQRQLNILKTTQSVQQATLKVHETLLSNQSSTKVSLHCIRQRQAEKQHNLTASEILSTESNEEYLDRKIKEAKQN